MDRDARVVKMEGLLRGHLPVTVLFAGRTARLPEVRALLFSGPSTQHDLGASSPLSPRHEAESLEWPHADVTMWEAWPWETSIPGDSYVVQAWLDAHANPGRDGDAFLRQQVSDTVKRNLRKADRRGLTLRVSHDVDESDRFYHQMLLPMAEAVFGSDKYLPDLATYRAYGAGAEKAVLFVERDGRPLAGAALLYGTTPPELALRHYGVVAEVLDDKALRAELMALLNAWVYRDAATRGLEVNLALTRPYMDDGVFNYKRQWGCWLQPLPAYGRYRLRFAPDREDELLEAAPLFHVVEGGIAGVMAFTPSTPDPVKALRDQLNAAVFDGLRRVEVRVRGPAVVRDDLERALPSLRGCPLVYRAARATPSAPVEASPFGA